MKGCLSAVRRHVAFMKESEIFTSRDCTIYGRRTAVDSALRTLVEKKMIVRLADGVFIRNKANFVWPGVEIVARAKAEAFGKRILADGLDTAAKYGLTPNGNQEVTFLVDGSGSKFQYRGITVIFKQACPKKMRLADDGAGLTVRALCSLGKSNCQSEQIQKLAPLWDYRSEKDKILTGKAWMPAWLGDKFPPNRYVGPYGPGRSNVIENPPSGEVFRSAKPRNAKEE